MSKFYLENENILKRDKVSEWRFLDRNEGAVLEEKNGMIIEGKWY